MSGVAFPLSRPGEDNLIHLSVSVPPSKATTWFSVLVFAYNFTLFYVFLCWEKLLVHLGRTLLFSLVATSSLSRSLVYHSKRRRSSQAGAVCNLG